MIDVEQKMRDDLWELYYFLEGDQGRARNDSEPLDHTCGVVTTIARKIVEAQREEIERLEAIVAAK